MEEYTQKLLMGQPWKGYPSLLFSFPVWNSVAWPCRPAWKGWDVQSNYEPQAKFNGNFFLIASKEYLLQTYTVKSQTLTGQTEKIKQKHPYGRMVLKYL